MTRTLPFPVYDADNHLYEPREALTRYLPDKFKRDFYFVEKEGRTKLIINGMLSEYIPNPTFEVVARPGGWETWFRAENHEGKSRRELQGKAVRPPESWLTGKGRTELLDEQGVHATLIFPTLASVIEERIGHRGEVTGALFHSLNEWMADEWGFAHDERLYAVPFINLTDIDNALAELEFVLSKGARCVNIRPGPVAHIEGSRSFGLKEYDPFWARCADAGIFVTLHGSDSGYDQVSSWWRGTSGEYTPFERDTFGMAIDLIGMATTHSMLALICHGVFERHPTLKVASIENGATWVRPMLQRLDRAFGQMPHAFKTHPRDQFQTHVWVAPFYEDDVNVLKNDVPVERMLFGSDYPHPEGLANPLDYLDEFEKFPADDVEKIFSANLKGLLAGVPI